VTKRMPWARVLGEGAVIVISILLAFAIDAWWAGVGDRKREELALAGLETDFTGYLEALTFLREMNQARAESAKALVNLSGPDPEKIDTAKFQDLLSRVLTVSPIILPVGTLGSLQEIDGLAVISDPTLRLELLAWSRDLGFSREMNDYLLENSREFDDFLKPRYPMIAILRRLTRQNLTTDDHIVGAGFPADVMTLLKDQEFANHVAYAESASIAMINSVDQMLEQAEQVLSLIRKSSADD
jgi:hypothetical protein